ncbi:MAG: zinc ribbon domain-containing protein [Actinobacteria bacterium]|nr:zinc ribbon domain-containing protein [Actinomycetota bacterium]
MPIYEYRCENEHVFDIMQSMSENPLTECVECGAPVKKVLQPVGISFKGSGFYSTDYNNKKGPKPESKETAKTGESNTNGTSGSEGSGEKKPEKTSTESTKKAD